MNTVHNTNKRPMGHITHLRNQFKSINTFVPCYDYTITLIKRKTPIFFLRIKWSFMCKKLESPPLKDAMCQVWLKLAQWFWRRFLKFFKYFLLFCHYLPLEKDGHFIWKKLDFPLPKDTLCQIQLKLIQWSRKRGQKCEKFTITTLTTERQTKDKFWSEKLTWALSSHGLKCLLKPKVRITSDYRFQHL